MKFRTAISEVKMFYQLVYSVGSVSEKCIVRLSSEFIEIICPGKNDEGVQVWSKLDQLILFTDYRVQSNTDNIICAEVVTDKILRVLRNVARSTKPPVMKLAKKDDHAVFAFEMTEPETAQTKARTNARTKGLSFVNISILRPAEMETLIEPMCAEPDVHIVTPLLKDLRTVFHRLRSFGSQICVSANNSGQLKVSTETDDADRMETTWQGCIHPTLESNDNDPPRDPPDLEQYFHVQVSEGSFLKFMSSAIISPATCIACICENQALIMYVYLGGVSKDNGIITFYIPARLAGDEE